MQIVHARTRTSRGGLLRLPPALVGVLALAVAGAALLGWSEGPGGTPAPRSPSRATASARSRHPTAVPPGWEVVADGQVLLSVPPAWEVEEQRACPGASPSGAIDLGPVPVAFCPAGTHMVGWVVVQPAPRTPSYLRTAHRTTVNGLVVYVDDHNPLEWYLLPSGLELRGGGPDASVVLHSVRALTWASLPRSPTGPGTPSHRGAARTRRPSSKPVGYGRLLLAVPGGWPVRYAPLCPEGPKGVIDLGDQEGAVASCPVFGESEVVSVAPPPTRVSIPAHVASHRVVVNDVVVDASDSGSGRTSLSWLVPSQGVELSATGSRAAAVLHSIRMLPTGGSR